MPSFHVQRSVTVNDTPENVFNKVRDFSTWTTWSPWLCAEPDADVTVSVDSSSVGSTYAWKGEVVGQGEVEHLRLESGRLIEEEIRFVKPFKSKSSVFFEFEAVEGGTTVTWRMKGSMPWFLFWMIPQMEIFIGMDYERGLKMLKEWIETGAILSQTKIQGIETVGPLTLAGVRRKCGLKEVAASMEASFAEVTEKFCQYDLPTGGAGASVYHHFDMKAQTFDYTSGFIVPESTEIAGSGLSCWSVPAVRALRVDHTGSYDHVGNGWSAAYQYARYRKLKQSKAGTFEIYRNDPSETDTAELLTEIYLPLK